MKLTISKPRCVLKMTLLRIILSHSKVWFRACWICPLDRSEPLSKLPTQDSFISECNSLLNETLIDLLKKNPGCERENQKWTHRKKLANLGRYCPQLCLSSMPCKALQKQREKRERTMSPLVTGRRKVIAMMRGNVNLAKKFGMEKMTTGIYYNEEQYYEIDIENKLFLFEESC